MGALHLSFIEAYRESKNIHVAAAKASFALSWCNRDKPKDYYVYGLIDPITNELFYIGKGKGKRWRDHARQAKGENAGCNKQKTERILALYSAGILDIPAISLASGLSEDNALLLEKQFIDSLPDLTNSTRWIRSAAWERKANIRIAAQYFLRQVRAFKGIKTWAKAHYSMTENDDRLFGELESLIIKIGTDRIKDASTQESKA